VCMETNPAEEKAFPEPIERTPPAPETPVPRPKRKGKVARALLSQTQKQSFLKRKNPIFQRSFRQCVRLKALP
jgi:hypothetical protein